MCTLIKFWEDFHFVPPHDISNYYRLVLILELLSFKTTGFPVTPLRVKKAVSKHYGTTRTVLMHRGMKPEVDTERYGESAPPLPFHIPLH